LPYLLDTNSVSYLMEKRSTIAAKIAGAGGLRLVAISAITVAELRYGVEALPAGRKRDARLTSLDAFLNSGIEILPFDRDAGSIYGWAGSLLKSAGVAFSFPDLAIASVALARGRTVASNDGFFERAQEVCGLSFERWAP
jgi:predicted nucleic acid-binding protein